MPQIEVTFDIDANGILHVTAADKKTGKEQKISIEGSSGLSDEEIEKAKRDAEEHAEEDKKRAENVDIKNKAEHLAYDVEKQLGDLGDQAPAELKTMLESKVEAVKEALKGDDLDAIKAASEDLEKSMAEMMNAAQQAAQEAGIDPAAAAAAAGGAATAEAPAEEEGADEPRQAKGKVVDAEVVDAD